MAHWGNLFHFRAIKIFGRKVAQTKLLLVGFSFFPSRLFLNYVYPSPPLYSDDSQIRASTDIASYAVTRKQTTKTVIFPYLRLTHQSWEGIFGICFYFTSMAYISKFDYQTCPLLLSKVLTVSKANPFVRRESHDRATIRVYQVFSLLSWLLVVVTGVYYSFQKPHDVPDGHTIWGQAKRYQTPFSQNIFITGIYW